MCSLDEFTCSDGEDKTRILWIKIPLSGACISMDRRCDQFPNCGDFSDEEFRLFQFSNIDRFTEYRSGQLPAGGEGQQLHPRLRTLRGGQAGEVDQDGTSNHGLQLAHSNLNIWSVVRGKFVWQRTKHRKNCKCCPVSLLIARSQRLSEFRFSIVRIVISVSNVAILQDCLCNCQNRKLS